MCERFVVDLENNHHYILVDTITGYQYYTPAQDDALSICGMLNNQQKMLENQRQELAQLKTKLQGMGVSVNEKQEYCKTCANNDLFGLSVGDDDVWCNVKDKSVYKYDWCNQWVNEKKENSSLEEEKI